MGKIKDVCQEFLDNGGSYLGYSMENLPDINDFNYILSHNVWAKTYSKEEEND
tara:strand:- start:7169 stop:7327 length:159 start_codon:yes stop_codon:yes gene_type:complete